MKNFLLFHFVWFFLFFCSAHFIVSFVRFPFSLAVKQCEQKRTKRKKKMKLFRITNDIFPVMEKLFQAEKEWETKITWHSAVKMRLNEKKKTDFRRAIPWCKSFIHFALAVFNWLHFEFQFIWFEVHKFVISTISSVQFSWKYLSSESLSDETKKGERERDFAIEITMARKIYRQFPLHFLCSSLAQKISDPKTNINR